MSAAAARSSGSRLELEALGLQGLVAVRRQRMADDRGSLSRLFCAEELAAAGWAWPVAQINHTVTLHRGAVRGFHFQRPPHAEAKLVSCLRGAVWDVAVDLRQGSPTFLQHCALELSPENGQALLIPPGFAHGFQALREGVELLYLHSAAHAPGSEAGLHPQDPALAVAWPLEVTQMSLRDRSHPFMDLTAFEGISLP